MKFNFLTLFPNYFEIFLAESIIKKAIDKQILAFKIVDIRDFAFNKHKKVDDKIYGGFPGMLLQIEPLVLALESVKGYRILLSPQGKPFNQKIAQRLAKKTEITFLCGRYEGFDERIHHFIDEEISIGDYILTGGELPAMVIADTVARLVPGVIKENSVLSESFADDNLLDFPQYTRPRIFRNLEVPEVLVNGNHKQIAKWVKQQQQYKTKKNRPDLWEKIKDAK